VQAPFGLRRDDLIVKDVPPDVLQSRLAAYQSWKASRASDVERAGRPSVDVITATNAAAQPDLWPASAVPVALISSSAGGVRPGGARFGSLVHALLSDAPLDGDAANALPRLAEAHGRILGATPEEISAAMDAVAATLAHPELAAARRADRSGMCYRETPVTLRLESGAVVEGYVDLAYRNGNEMVVVDFKTDRELESALDRYERQVSLYAAAIGRSTGLPVRAVLIRV
jgi:ATP-dependent exoDNAse (exonuclease V) beta subunit